MLVKGATGLLYKFNLSGIKAWMSNNILTIYVDAIAYPCPKLGVGLDILHIGNV